MNQRALGRRCASTFKPEAERHHTLLAPLFNKAPWHSSRHPLGPAVVMPAAGCTHAQGGPLAKGFPAGRSPPPCPPRRGPAVAAGENAQGRIPGLFRVRWTPRNRAPPQLAPRDARGGEALTEDARSAGITSHTQSLQYSFGEPTSPNSKRKYLKWRKRVP